MLKGNTPTKPIPKHRRETRFGGGGLFFLLLETLTNELTNK